MKHRGLLAGVIALSLATGSVAFAAETAPAAPVTPPAEVANAAAPVAAPAAPAAAAAPAPATTPLATRPAKPLTLAPKEESTPFGYKLLALVGLAGAGGLWWHKKKKEAAEGDEPKKKKKKSKIDILSRQSVGVRNELLVVDVEGTRLLVGMTPGAMQTLAVLEQPEPLTEVSDEAKAEADARPTIQRLPEPAPVPGAAAEDDEDDLPPVSYVPPKPRQETNVAALDQKVRSLLATRAPEPTKATPSMTVPKRRRANNAKTARIAGQAKGLLLAMNEESEPTARTGEM